MLLLSTSSLKWYWLHKIFTFAKKAGYDGIDLVMEKLGYDTLNTEYIKWLSDAFGIPVLSITAYDKWLSEKKVDEIIKMAMTLKTQVVTFSPPHMTDSNKKWFNSYLPKIRRDNRISIAVQNVESKFILFVIPEHTGNNFMDIKRVTWDTTLNISALDKNWWIDLLKAQKILWNSIRNVFFCDKYGPREGILPWSAWGWVSHLPLESFLMKLRTSSYSWYLTLKVRPAELEVWNDDKVLQNLEYMKKYYKKHYLDFKWDNS